MSNRRSRLSYASSSSFGGMDSSRLWSLWRQLQRSEGRRGRATGDDETSDSDVGADNDDDSDDEMAGGIQCATS